MQTFREAAAFIRDAIDRDLPLVIHDFFQHSAVGPWPLLDRLPPHDPLERLIRLVVHVALRDHEPTSLRNLLDSAADYGLARFQQGLSEGAILYDFDTLRQTLWSYIRDRTHLTGDLPLEAIVRLDHALAIAAPAALRGFHRLDFDARGHWPLVLDQLEMQWIPLPPIV